MVLRHEKIHFFHQRSVESCLFKVPGEVSYNRTGWSMYLSDYIYHPFVAGGEISMVVSGSLKRW